MPRDEVRETRTDFLGRAWGVGDYVLIPGGYGSPIGIVEAVVTRIMPKTAEVQSTGRQTGFWAYGRHRLAKLEHRHIVFLRPGDEAQGDEVDEAGAE